MQITDRTLEYTATRAVETIVDCTGTTSAPAKGYVETLTYEIVSPTGLVNRPRVEERLLPDHVREEVNRCE